MAAADEKKSPSQFADAAFLQATAQAAPKRDPKTLTSAERIAIIVGAIPGIVSVRAADGYSYVDYFLQVDFDDFRDLVHTSKVTTGRAFDEFVALHDGLFDGFEVYRDDSGSDEAEDTEPCLWFDWASATEGRGLELRQNRDKMRDAFICSACHHSKSLDWTDDCKKQSSIQLIRNIVIEAGIQRLRKIVSVMQDKRLPEDIGYEEYKSIGKVYGNKQVGEFLDRARAGCTDAEIMSDLDVYGGDGLGRDTEAYGREILSEFAARYPSIDGIRISYMDRVLTANWAWALPTKKASDLTGTLH